MTYKELLEKLSTLSDEQLNCTVTVEMGPEDEYYPAELRICGDQDRPVIFVE